MPPVDTQATPCPPISTQAKFLFFKLCHPLARRQRHAAHQHAGRMMPPCRTHVTPTLNPEPPDPKTLPHARDTNPKPRTPRPQNPVART
eukprot:6191-Chlamydomonas_euryale.AAC.1